VENIARARLEWRPTESQPAVDRGPANSDQIFPLTAFVERLGGGLRVLGEGPSYAPYLLANA
jgi:hypothetical protein